MSQIGDVGNTIPGVQAADINDGNILQATRTVDIGNGTLRYEITLPSGRALESSPFQEEHKRKAMIMWCDSVREAIVGDVARANDEQLRARRDREMAERVLELDDAGNTNRKQQPILEALRNKEPLDWATPSPTEMPYALIKRELANAESTLDSINTAAKQLAKTKTAAEAAVRQWTAMKAAFEAATGTPARRQRSDKGTRRLRAPAEGNVDPAPASGA